MAQQSGRGSGLTRSGSRVAGNTAAKESAFTLDTSSIKYGPGVTREVGFDMKNLGAERVMVVTDPRLADSEPVAVALAALRAEGIDAVLYDQVRVEPTDISFHDAIDFAREGNFDGYLSVGGGSTIDTAKAANLYATYPAEFLDYVNPPIGKGVPVPGALRPHIAVPTTAGTGSETTGVAICDLTEMHVKTGIAHRALRPQIGVLDPHNTRTLPQMAAASTGLDVLSHALESLTALPYDSRVAPESPGMRPAYQGANPISDIWATKAIEMVAANLVRAIEDTEDDEARSAMLLAAAYAGIGFGNAGVHLPHGMSYPVSGDGTQLQTARVPDGSPDHSARNGGYPQRAGSLSFHRSDESCEAPVCGAADGCGHFRRGRRGCRRAAGGGDHQPDAEDRRAQRSRCHRLYGGGHSSVGKGDFAPTPGDEAVAAAGRGERPGSAVQRCDAVLVRSGNSRQFGIRICPGPQPYPVGCVPERAASGPDSYFNACANTCAMWSGARPVNCSIWSRQLVPLATKNASAGIARAAGKRRSSPMARLTS